MIGVKTFVKNMDKKYFNYCYNYSCEKEHKKCSIVFGEYKKC